ncbi:hypothetical protein RRG08_026031 [Elysia crispata]|uniref:Uncharacterized protein n=1 Tax=Elysia crispata TaxID=231223 RepID=A0AAE1BEK0_9GAST|nr:hypothetical protein RRG08_026031 [Elysia crispata]
MSEYPETCKLHLAYTLNQTPYTKHQWFGFTKLPLFPSPCRFEPLSSLLFRFNSSLFPANGVDHHTNTTTAVNLALSPSPHKDTSDQSLPSLSPSPPPRSTSGANLGVQLVNVGQALLRLRGASVPRVRQAYGHSGGNTPGDMAR